MTNRLMFIEALNRAQVLSSLMAYGIKLPSIYILIYIMTSITFEKTAEKTKMTDSEINMYLVNTRI